VKRKAYTSDLTQKQFTRLEHLIPKALPGGAPRTVNMFEIINAILYVLRNGCVWRDLPHDFPKWQTVYSYFRRFQKDEFWAALNRKLVRDTRKAIGRNPEPSAAITDSQTVRCTPQAGIRGVDAGKKTNGRKRHVLVDSLGLMLLVLVTHGAIQDRDGAKLVFDKARLRFPGLKLVWADGGYRGTLVDWTMQVCKWVLEIVKRSDDVKGFKVLPKRWVVERSLAWLTRCRRLVRDFEGLPEVTESWVYLANIRLMLRRLDPS
jgi:putative transposase